MVELTCLFTQTFTQSIPHTANTVLHLLEEALVHPASPYPLSWRQLRQKLVNNFCWNDLALSWQPDVSESAQGFNLHACRTKRAAILPRREQGGPAAGAFSRGLGGEGDGMLHPVQ